MIDLRFRYEDDGIYTDRPNDAAHRNRIKAKNLNVINSSNVVFNLPIEVYYFSCNLDHVLHKNRNLEQSLKNEYAFHFADGYENKEDEFIDFLSIKSLFLSFDYKTSWMKIKDNNNSLLRYTNLMVFFLNNMDSLKDEVKEKVRRCTY